MTRVLLFFVTFCAPLFAANTKFTNTFQRCKKLQNDDNCLNSAIQEAVLQLCKQGLPKLNIPKLDPIQTPKITFGSNGTAVNIVQEYTDVKLYGFTEAIISNSHIDWNKKLISFTTLLPKLSQHSHYVINGRILILPVYGKGDSVLSMTNTTVIHNILFEETEKGGSTYIKVKLYTFGVVPQGITFQLDNLYNGNKQLSDALHKVLNENWQLIWEETREGFEEAYGQILSSIANQLFSQIPAEDLFL